LKKIALACYDAGVVVVKSEVVGLDTGIGYVHIFLESHSWSFKDLVTDYQILDYFWQQYYMIVISPLDGVRAVNQVGFFLLFWLLGTRPIFFTILNNLNIQLQKTGRII
jgi:hypothetical protein